MSMERESLYSKNEKDATALKSDCSIISNKKIQIPFKNDL